MARLFEIDDLDSFLAGLPRMAAKQMESLPEDDILSRSPDDLLEELSILATVTPLAISADPVDGSVAEVRGDELRHPTWDASGGTAFEVVAVYEFGGDSRLFDYRPQTYISVRLEADLGPRTLTLRVVVPSDGMSSGQIQAALAQFIGRIRTMANYASSDAERHNTRLIDELRSAVEQRKARIQQRRNLSGASGGEPTLRRSFH